MRSFESAHKALFGLIEQRACGGSRQWPTPSCVTLRTATDCAGWDGALAYQILVFVRAAGSAAAAFALS